MKLIARSINLYYLAILLSPILSYLTLTQYNISSQYYFGVLITILGVIFMVNNIRRITIPSYAWFLLVYFFYTLTWTFFTGEAAERSYRVIFKNPVFHSFFAIVIINNFYFTDKFKQQSIRIIKLTVVLAAIASVIQLFNYNFLDANTIWTRGNHALIGDLYEDRRLSIFGYIDPNELGLSFLPLLSVLLGILLRERKRSYIVFLVLGILISILSNTRYVLGGMIIISIQIIIMNRRRFLGTLKYIAIISLVVLLFSRLLSTFGFVSSDWVNNRLFPEGSITETTRYKAIFNFMYFFPKKPVLGYGTMTEEIRNASLDVGSSQIHVGYLAHLVYYGILGSFLFFSFIFLLSRRLYLNAKKTNYWGSFFGFLVFVWANLTLVTFHIFFYGLIFAVLYDKIYKDRFIKR